MESRLNANNTLSFLRLANRLKTLPFILFDVADLCKARRLNRMMYSYGIYF